MRLTDRHPHLDAAALVTRLVPPRRFEDVRFDTYCADPEHPSQAQALESLKLFATDVNTPAASRKRFWSRPDTPSPTPPARYLDGGFGVGKTHLLAGLWHATEGTKAYTTFSELTAFIGFTGMQTAISSLSSYHLLCIDEFELDDVGNTLMVVSLLRGIIDRGTRLAVTSNTLPQQLGEQRFSASEYRREIAAIAAYFAEIRIDGPDFRQHSGALPLAVLSSDDLDTVTVDHFDELLPHLRRVHPVHYGPMLDGLHGVRIHGLRTIDDQGLALLFVQFVDKLYDARIPVRVEGWSIGEVFAASYRNGGYSKKYSRAESRLNAMQKESEGIL